MNINNNHNSFTPTEFEKRIEEIVQCAVASRSKGFDGLSNNIDNYAVSGDSVCDKALAEMSVFGVSMIMQNRNPKFIEEMLTFGYSCYYEPPYKWGKTYEELINRANDIYNIAVNARANGLLTLENAANSTSDYFLRTALMMVFDGYDSNWIRSLLEKRIENEEKCGKTRKETDISRLTAKGVLLIADGVRPDIIQKKLTDLAGKMGIS